MGGLYCPPRFQLESSGNWAIPGHLEESILAEGPAKLDAGIALDGITLGQNPWNVFTSSTNKHILPQPPPPPSKMSTLATIASSPLPHHHHINHLLPLSPFVDHNHHNMNDLETPRH
ncbi:hypothetical protein K443DRAFT_8866 [Laccaria amethystina LaAM-08-1]|uniref:Uncharacterized protein n=1 Tax=Laccaria amethystina LaAM-08-1 TaxID=1095629 RepID=A0A0C9X139_9AGAR|nr:hypothetical protein K443DRAFT_8866 [Laccaria amethystina LaAM-08-1]